ncbi:anthranilate synthase component I family protein [Roseiconus nitratireducens]|uniref:Anthranilate synthase component I family protein n=2 Tax=Roseiconus nitratireducens TaxID=2605748 RepID=A0A5M6D1F9_9BACT|nr:anthranilate synthase component I family protein [Roseiconus nitratireducens]
MTAEEVFGILAGSPGLMWLDSASSRFLHPKSTATGDHAPDPDAESVLTQLARYSFLSCDPVHRLVANLKDADPWDELARLESRLPKSVDTDLPPFQGGIAGLIGYEASRWLEPLALSGCDAGQTDDLPTPALWMGLYDWVIAFDHVQRRGWLVSQGFTAADLHGSSPPDHDARWHQANSRADEVLARLRGCSNTTKSQDGVTTSQDSDGLPGSIGGGPPSPLKGAATTWHGIVSSFSSEAFRAAVADIVRRIRNGDSFQVNLSQRLLAEATLAAPELYRRLREANPAPYAGYLDGGTFQVLSSSPEGFLQLRDGVLQTRPIKGTVPRTGDRDQDARLAEQLAASGKDRAENIMIVDLMRNDLSRVCEDDSVIVRQLCRVERYQFVQHLVSVVEGRLRPGQGAVDALRACFPGGSVTGAPKIEAMRTIAELEPHPRGPYCGSLGYIGCGGRSDFNILIRTITAAGGYWQIPVGGGITAQSQPSEEEAETWAKAVGMLRALPPPVLPRESNTPRGPE